MLALIGITAIAALLALIVTNRASPLVALILVPTVAAVVAGLGSHLPDYVVAGVTRIAPVVGMFVFAILFFGIMTDAGLLQPLIGGVLRVVGRSPERIAVGTALLALLIHLDGSGAVCFLVTIPALRPLYDEIGMDRRVLACTASMAAGVNFLPWTGPTLRASAALHISPYALFTPMIGVQLAGLAFVFAASWWLGRRERTRLALQSGGGAAMGASPAAAGAGRSAAAASGGWRIWANLLLTLAVIATMIAGLTEPVVAFMLGTALALAINHPGASAQRDQIEAHARAALLMASILLAAGAFTGVMTGSGMLAATADAGARHMPGFMGGHLAPVVAVLSMPLSLLFDPDSFYFGVLPVLGQVAGQFGTPPVDIARAALLGQMTTGFPISPLTPATFLVAGLSGIELGAHQRFAFPWLFGATLVMAATALVTGLLPW
jgi:CitMHS family citrate-Mg2+:H+ or citrate-Ca2+:H+ symporter